MRRSRQRVLSTCVLLGISAAGSWSTAFAAAAEPGQTVKLADSYVHPDYAEVDRLRDTKQVIVIRKKDIEDKGYRSVTDVLKDQPEITVGAAGYGSIDIRGQGSGAADRNVQILVDGAPITALTNHPNQMVYDVVPIEQVDKIEIIPGGGSVMYGTGASGGVINITTNLKNLKNAKNNLTTEIKPSGGYRASLAYNFPLGETVKMNVAAARTHENLYFDDTFRKEKYVAGGVRWDLDKTQHLTLRASHADVDSRYIETVQWRYLKQYGRHYKPGTYGNGDSGLDSYNLTYQKNFGKAWTINADAFYGEGDFLNMATGESDDKRCDYKNKGTRIKLDHAYGKHKKNHLLLGLDYLNQTQVIDYYNTAGTKLYKYDYDKTTAALYLLNTHKRGKLSFSEGVRRDKVDWEYSKISGGAQQDNYDSIRWNTAAELSTAYQYRSTGKVYLRYERGFSLPDGMQISNRIYRDGRQTYVPAGCRDEHYNLYELGWRDKLGATLVNLTLFASYTDNELERTYIYNPRLEYRTVNMYDVRRRGAELKLSQRLGKATFTEAYAYMKGKRSYSDAGRAFRDTYGLAVDEWANNGLAKVPKHKAIFQTNYKFDKRWQAGLKYTFFGSYTNFTQTKNADDGGMFSYGLLDLDFRWQAGKKLTVYGGITNLLDKEYYEYDNNGNPSEGTTSLRPGYGRTYYLGARYTF